MVGESMSGWQSGNGFADGVLTEERPGAAQPDGMVDEQRRRRRAAEAAADAAEAAAADAAARASAAIAAAASAAADAEAAADLAARAAADAESAAADERRAVERAHALTAVSANETTTVALSAVPPASGPVNGSPDGPSNGVRPARHRPSVPVQALPPDEAAVARAATMTISDTPIRNAPAPTAGGRAARRRAQEAAAAAAAVSREANRDPDTHVFTVDREPDPAASSRAGSGGRRRSAAPRGWSPAALLARLRARPGSRMVLVAGAVGGVILVAALVAGLVGGARGASTAAVVQAAPVTTEAAAPTSAASDLGVTADPTSPKAVAFLKALRAADVPTSDSGRSETEAAEVICLQLANGADAPDLVRALPAVLPTVNSKQAKSVVSLAQKNYCS